MENKLTDSRIYSFAPVSTPSAKVLILGSMPGIASLNAGQYYAHPQNQFWRIMDELTGCNLDKTYDQRIEALKIHRIAVWDVLKSCVRPGSLDSAISRECLNDFPEFFTNHPGVTHIFFNGLKAEQSFRKWVLPDIGAQQYVLIRLPSTSPAHASISFEQKCGQWKAVLAAL